VDGAFGEWRWGPGEWRLGAGRRGTAGGGAAAWHV